MKKLSLLFASAAAASIAICATAISREMLITIQTTEFLASKYKTRLVEQIDISTISRQGSYVLARGKDTEQSQTLNFAKVVATPVWAADCIKKEIARDPSASETGRKVYSVSYIGNNRWKLYGTSVIYGATQADKQRERANHIARGGSASFFDKLEAYGEEHRRRTLKKHTDSEYYTNIFRLLCNKEPETKLGGPGTSEA